MQNTSNRSTISQNGRQPAPHLREKRIVPFMRDDIVLSRQAHQTRDSDRHFLLARILGPTEEDGTKLH